MFGWGDVLAHDALHGLGDFLPDSCLSGVVLGRGWGAESFGHYLFLSIGGSGSADRCDLVIPVTELQQLAERAADASLAPLSAGELGDQVSGVYPEFVE